MPKNMLFLYEIMAVFVHAKKLVAPKLTPAIRKISSPEMCYLAFFSRSCKDIIFICYVQSHHSLMQNHLKMPESSISFASLYDESENHQIQYLPLEK